MSYILLESYKTWTIDAPHLANINFNSHRIVVANVCSTTSKIEKYKNIVIFMWGRGSKKGPSACYKIFQDGAARLMHAVKMAHVIKNSDHINTMNGQTNFQCVRKDL